MSNRYSLTKSILLVVAVWCWLGLLPSPVAQAKIYKWKDASGKVHYTDSLSKIPPQYRQGPGLETVKEAPPAPGDVVRLHLPAKISREHVIPLQPLGDNFAVKVLLNDKVEATLLVDTGASSVTLSEEIAKKLGFRNLDRLPQLVFSTAGGELKAPLIALKKVRVGEAEVRNVEANINPFAGGEGFDGLLGMTFLANYKVVVRLDTSQMILKPLNEPGDKLWGGYNGSWWKRKFLKYTQKVLQFELLKGRLRGDPVRGPNIKKLFRHYKDLHKGLDKQADRARVPKKLRSYP